jgi:hypothetical protein
MAVIQDHDDPDGWSEFLKAIDSASTGSTRLLAAWLQREIDEHGLPRRLPVARWWDALSALDTIVSQRPRAWPDGILARIEALLRSALRWSRPDGSAVFSPGPVSPDRAGVAQRWADRLADPSLQTVTHWWFGSADDAPGPPPLPARASESRVLAILRADWRADGDFLAVEQNPCEPHQTNRLELVASGRRILGPGIGFEGALTTESRPVAPLRWATGPMADVFEWESGSGRRTVILFRGRRLALVAQEVADKGPASLQLDLAPGVVAEPRSTAPGVVRLIAPRRVKVDAIPIGQPGSAGTGGLESESSCLHLNRHSSTGGWLPVLFSWDPERARRRPLWRPLTVTERGRVCGPEEAFAARVSWGPGENLLVYRTLGPTALRAVLGHPTSARLLVGFFTDKGDVRPLVQLADEV